MNNENFIGYIAKFKASKHPKDYFTIVQYDSSKDKPYGLVSNDWTVEHVSYDIQKNKSPEIWASLNEFHMYNDMPSLVFDKIEIQDPKLTPEQVYTNNIGENSGNIKTLNYFEFINLKKDEEFYTTVHLTKEQHGYSPKPRNYYNSSKYTVRCKIISEKNSFL